MRLPFVLGGVVWLAAAGAVRPAPAQTPSLALDSSYSCVMCHIDHRRAFLTGVHADRGIRCHDCHGGDPAARTEAGAHSRRFLGRPTKSQIATLCASCHSDPNRMRQFGLRSDEFAGLKESRHGQLLERGDPNAPTCTDCHEAHLIRRATDARSNTHPTNIPVLCARCHADKALMARYGIPTNQFEQYASSAHGRALFQDRNFAAPTCVGCHGSHSALPPGVSQVADVCGRCHQLVREAFNRGPHAAPAARGQLSGCIACHSNHGTEHVAPGAIAAACGRCHPAGTHGAAVADSLQARAVAATEELAAAGAAIARLERAGRPTAEALVRYEGARTSFGELAQIQHSLDMNALEDLGLKVASAARTVEESADVAAEGRWEHKLLLVPVWFLALAVLVLARYVRAEARDRHEGRGRPPE